MGGYAVEALARSGVGALDLIDDDKICLTNLNRQIFATRSTIGQYKVDVAKARILDINPNAQVTTYRTFYLPDTADQFDFTQYDYVVDAIDTVTAKIQIILQAQEAGVPVISAMGCGNRTDPTKLTVTDLFRTSQDPLARVMRRELKRRGVRKLKVVYSTEPAIRPLEPDSSCQDSCSNSTEREQAPAGRRSLPGSTSFVPPAAGMMIAAAVINDLTHFDPETRTKGGQQNHEEQG